MGSPADVILKVATDTASELIVIGARGAGAFARFTTHFGSIAHKVVSHAACPVLTVGGTRMGQLELRRARRRASKTALRRPWNRKTETDLHNHRGRRAHLIDSHLLTKHGGYC